MVIGEYAQAVKVRRLYPDSAEVEAAAAIRGLGFGERAPADRPYVALNMVSTLDGRIVIDGRSGPIGNDADRELFHGLRTQVDAVMVGAGTVRTERYGPMVRGEERRRARVEDGLAPNPLAVVVSARLNLPPDLPLLQDPDSEVLVLTASDGDLPPTPAKVDYMRASRNGGSLVLAPLLRRLRHDHGIRSILCEGGPALNEGLAHEGLLDELFLSLAPKLAGGEPMTMIFGPTLDPIPSLELVWVLESEGHLFLRHRWPR